MFGAGRTMKTTLILVAILAMLGLYSVSGKKADIIYKRVEMFEEVYNNKLNSYARPVSIWRPRDVQSGYYAVGDSAVASHSIPTSSAIMVKEVTPGSLAEPVDFIEVWNNDGTYGMETPGIRIMRMVPPTGFTCLGHVAVFYARPRKEKYRCVKNSYITTGKYGALWNDRGSGATMAVSLWENEPAADLHALDAFTFTSTSSTSTYSIPSGSPAMIDGRKVLNHMEIELERKENYVFTIFETTDMKEIWNSGGSRGYQGLVSVWRGQGRPDTFSLGDVVYDGAKPSKAYVVKANKTDALKPAYDYEAVWDDIGSGAYKAIKVYSPKCPPGYRAIGEVAMASYNEKPTNDVFRCVKGEYTTKGGHEWEWNSGGSGSKDVTFYKTIALDETGQGVDTLATVNILGSISKNAFVLIADQVNYVTGKPAVKYILENVVYKVSEAQKSSPEPETMARTVIENQGSSEQKATRELAYSYDETYSWGNSAGVEIGIETEVRAGIPLIGSTEFTTTVTSSYSHEWGGSTSETKSDQITAEITVTPRSKKTAVIIGKRFTTDVPYTATLISVYADGTRDTRKNYKGLFKGVEINEIRVVYEPDIPLA